MPAERAREVLERGEYANEVRQAERFWQEVGIHSVPAVIVDRKHLISGGQPSAVFEQALRQIAAEGAARARAERRRRCNSGRFATPSTRAARTASPCSLRRTI